MKKYIALSVLLIIILSFVFPIKFCLSAYPSECDGEFYVVRYDATKNWWILVGDSEGLKDWNTVSDYPVEITGENIKEIVSGDLYLQFQPTYFVLFGKKIFSEEYSDVNGDLVVVSRKTIIECTSWNVLGEISSRNKFRKKLNTNYFIVYDFKWFDKFRKLFDLYEEY